MMRKIRTAGLSDCHRHQHITKPEVSNPHHMKSVLLFLVIATGLLTTTILSVPTIIMTINAQASSSSGDNNGGDSETDKQMGICVVGAGGPCNGDSNLAR
jgi:hypothetical protein